MDIEKQVLQTILNVLNYLTESKERELLSTNKTNGIADSLTLEIIENNEKNMKIIIECRGNWVIPFDIFDYNFNTKIYKADYKIYHINFITKSFVRHEIRNGKPISLINQPDNPEDMPEIKDDEHYLFFIFKASFAIKECINTLRSFLIQHVAKPYHYLDVIFKCNEEVWQNNVMKNACVGLICEGVEDLLKFSDSLNFRNSLYAIFKSKNRSETMDEIKKYLEKYTPKNL